MTYKSMKITSKMTSKPIVTQTAAMTAELSSFEAIGQSRHLIHTPMHANTHTYPHYTNLVVRTFT